MDKYKHFFYNNLDLACFANLDGYFEELNENFTKVLGYTTEDLTERKFFEFIHPDDIEPTLKVVEKLSSGIKASNFINRYRAKSGVYKSLEWSAVVDLETKKISAIARDVTEKINADKELAFQNREKKKREIELTIANDEFLFQDGEKGKRAAELIIANKELAFQNKEKEQRALELTIANKELAFQNNEKERRAMELTIANKELAFQNNEKEKRAAELLIANKELAFQSDEKEKRAEELIIANNELKMAELERIKMTNDLIQRNKDLEQFSYIISHNLRSPVANIIGLSAAAQNENLDAGMKKGIMNGLAQSSKNLDEVIIDLNNILQTKRDVNQKTETVYFSKLTRDIESSIKNMIEAEEAVIVVDFSEVDEMLTLKSYLHSIFYNLISNSLKYRRPGVPPLIEIVSHQLKDKIELVFKDNGLGIDLENKGDKVFGLYKRFHTDIAEGKGMGLYMVKTQVESLGGKICIESEVDNGITFKIEFNV